MNDYSKLLDYFKESFGLIDYFHFNSETTQNVYSGNLHIENGKIIPITHSEIKDNRHKKSFDASILRIGFIGNDTPYKGLPLLLQVLKRITDKSSWRLDVWGGKVAQEKDWQIFYRGKFDSRSLATVYDGMDVLIVPSIWKETFGFVVLEALSYGVPVIVSDNVGAKDIVKQYDERFVFTSASELLALLNVLWSMSGPANQLLRQLGLLLFLAEVGTSAGKNLVATFEESGMLLFGVGAAITLVPMLVAVLVGRLVFNISLLDLLGTITGGMTSTPGLAAADSMVDSNIPSVAYATVYPIAMVVLILFIQIIASAVY